MGPDEGCDLLERIAQQSDPEAREWPGSELPMDQQGVTILGTPLGHPDFVSAQLQRKTQDHRILLERILAVTDVQSAWSLLLPRPANYILRVVRPDLVRAQPRHLAVLLRDSRCFFR